MRQRVRRTLVFISLLLFPVTLNYFSPYVSIDGAMAGVVSGSLLLFAGLFLSGLFFGRAWCAWVCPMAAVSDYAQGINDRPVNVKRLRAVRYTVFGVWAAVVIMMFILAGGIRGVDPLRLTEHGISVGAPGNYIIYYGVLAIFVALTLLLGRRGACHSICWMSPFLAGGYALGRLIRLRQLRVCATPDSCVGCGRCNAVCPMGVDVKAQAATGCIRASDCILCGRCVESCPKKVLYFGVR